MNIKLRRLVRTSSSEQYAVFDPERTDANYDPVSIGKLDLHYTTDGIYGTFLLWNEILQDLPQDQIRALVEAPVIPRGGLRVGYQLSTEDGFHSGECDTDCGFACLVVVVVRKLDR